MVTAPTPPFSGRLLRFAARRTVTRLAGSRGPQNEGAKLALTYACAPPPAHVCAHTHAGRRRFYAPENRKCLTRGCGNGGHVRTTVPRRMVGYASQPNNRIFFSKTERHYYSPKREGLGQTIASLDSGLEPLGAGAEPTMEQSSTRPVTDSRTARRKINQHLWKFHDHAVGMGDTMARYIFHETLHADSEHHDGSAGKPRHVHMSETDLDIIATIDE